ncbi:MAG: uroporphyrinogen decarboxylase [Desulfitibacter sp. BRH_c19]|nr:MAG: uroporphyrinogen decarboxylase [Desulfitibacter sp. BRH_c19]
MLNSRQRVLTVLSHKLPDRVPLDLCNSASFINDPAYFALKNHLNLKEEISPFRNGFTANYYDEKLLEALEIDFRHVWLKPPNTSNGRFNHDGTIVDEWGIKYQFLGNEKAIVLNPLDGLDETDLDKYPWPDPYNAGRVDGIAERAEYLARNTNYAVSAHAAHYFGFFDNGWILRGFERFMMDLVSNKKFIYKLLDKLLNIYLGLYDIYLDKVGGYVQMVAYSEDFGMQSAPFISPSMYKEIFFPLHKELFSFIKQKAPNAKVMLHTCGAVYPFIPYFIEAGVDVLNPIQNLAKDMNPIKIKKEYGSELVFHGGIDMQRALCGTVDDVKVEVQARMKDLGKDGGYIIAPANVIQGETPPENIITLYQTAIKYGQYNMKTKWE